MAAIIKADKLNIKQMQLVGKINKLIKQKIILPSGKDGILEIESSDLTISYETDDIYMVSQISKEKKTIIINVYRYLEETIDLFNYIACMLVNANFRYYKKYINDIESFKLIFYVKFTFENKNLSISKTIKGLNNKVLKDTNEYTKYCNYVLSTTNKKKNDFCTINAGSILKDIDQLQAMPYNTYPEKKNFRTKVEEIWNNLYNNHSMNSYIDINFYLDKYLNKFVNALVNIQNCYIGGIRIIFNDNVIIQGSTLNQILSKLEKCTSPRKVINVALYAQDGGHSNTLVIEKNKDGIYEVYRFEPNGLQTEVGFQTDKIDEVLKNFFKIDGVITYMGLHDQSCGISHPGLCQFVSKFQLVYGNSQDQQMLKKFICTFFRWMFKTQICTKQQHTKEKYSKVIRAIKTTKIQQTLQTPEIKQPIQTPEIKQPGVMDILMDGYNEVTNNKDLVLGITYINENKFKKLYITPSTITVDIEDLNKLSTWDQKLKSFFNKSKNDIQSIFHTLSNSRNVIIKGIYVGKNHIQVDQIEPIRVLYNKK